MIFRRSAHLPDGRFTRTEIAEEIERTWGRCDIANWLRKMDAVDDAQQWAEQAEKGARVGTGR